MRPRIIDEYPGDRFILVCPVVERDKEPGFVEMDLHPDVLFRQDLFLFYLDQDIANIYKDEFMVVGFPVGSGRKIMEFLIEVV